MGSTRIPALPSFYDRTSDGVSVDEVERVGVFNLKHRPLRKCEPVNQFTYSRD